MAHDEHVDLRVALPVEIDEALAHLAGLTRESKRSIVRRAVATALVDAGVLASSAVPAPTPTAGQMDPTRGRRDEVAA